MTESAIASRVREILATHYGVRSEMLEPATNFYRHLSGDDLDRLEVLLSIEEAFSINFPDEDLEEFDTVAGVIAITERRYAEAVKHKAA